MIGGLCFFKLAASASGHRRPSAHKHDSTAHKYARSLSSLTHYMQQIQPRLLPSCRSSRLVVLRLLVDRCCLLEASRGRVTSHGRWTGKAQFSDGIEQEVCSALGIIRYDEAVIYCYTTMFLEPLPCRQLCQEAMRTLIKSGWPT